MTLLKQLVHLCDGLGLLGSLAQRIVTHAGTAAGRGYMLAVPQRGHVKDHEDPGPDDNGLLVVAELAGYELGLDRLVDRAQVGPQLPSRAVAVVGAVALYR